MIAYLDEYHCCETQLLGKRPNVVEIGCFEPAKRVPFRAAPLARLYFVEASPTNYATLLARLLRRGPDVVTLNAALADWDGETTLYEYDHEQLSSLFPRHVAEAVQLRRSVVVPGFTLRSLLDKLDVKTCDLLLLNCEGAEIYAMRQLADDPALRGRVKQFCTSSHCRHIHIYPQAEWDSAVAALTPFYGVQSHEPVPNIPYYLFTRKP